MHRIYLLVAKTTVKINSDHLNWNKAVTDKKKMNNYTTRKKTNTFYAGHSTYRDNVKCIYSMYTLVIWQKLIDLMTNKCVYIGKQYCYHLNTYITKCFVQNSTVTGRWITGFCNSKGKSDVILNNIFLILHAVSQWFENK